MSGIPKKVQRTSNNFLEDNTINNYNSTRQSVGRRSKSGRLDVDEGIVRAKAENLVEKMIEARSMDEGIVKGELTGIPTHCIKILREIQESFNYGPVREFLLQSTNFLARIRNLLEPLPLKNNLPSYAIQRDLVTLLNNIDWKRKEEEVIQRLEQSRLGGIISFMADNHKQVSKDVKEICEGLIKTWTGVLTGK
ncbi:hypothetical protein PCE1_003455 [Barthelona sp. PCE]